MSWDQILDRMEQGAVFDLSGLDEEIVGKLFVSRVPEDEVDSAIAKVVAAAQRQASNRETLARIIEIVGSIAGVIISVRKTPM